MLIVVDPFNDYCMIYNQFIFFQNWIYNQLANLKTHSQIPTTDWWVGLNNREYLTTWEWADGSAIARNVM